MKICQYPRHDRKIAWLRFRIIKHFAFWDMCTWDVFVYWHTKTIEHVKKLQTLRGIIRELLRLRVQKFRSSFYIKIEGNFEIWNGVPLIYHETCFTNLSLEDICVPVLSTLDNFWTTKDMTSNIWVLISD